MSRNQREGRYVGRRKGRCYRTQDWRIHPLSGGAERLWYERFIRGRA